MKNVLVLNRWDDEFADYHRFVEGEGINLFCLTTKDSAKYIRQFESSYKGLVEVENFDDIVPIKKAVESWQKNFGHFSHLVSMSEFDIISSAKLREILSIPGMNLESAKAFRDKFYMKEILEKAQIKVPRNKIVESREDILHFAKDFNFPLVLKPRFGASSKGVKILNTYQEIEACEIPEDPEIEEFIEGSVYHTDGLVRDGEIVILKSSEYLNNCYSYLQGNPLGSIMINDQEDNQKIKKFTSKVIKSLGLKTGAFHLEFFKNQDEITFLEIGARIGGADVPFLFKEVLKFDIMRQWFRLEVGLAFDEKIIEELNGGWLIIPNPHPYECQIKEISLAQKSSSLVKETLWPPGKSLLPSGDYYKNLGRFLFSGNFNNVKKDMLSVIENLKVEYETA